MAWPLRKAIRIKSRLTDAEIDQLLDRLDFDSLCRQRLLSSRRKDKRYIYRARGVSIGLVQDGRDITLLACGRNLSTNGISFLHDGPIGPGTLCRVRMLDRQGQGHVAAGTVVHSRPLQKQLYEVGVRFDQPIDVSLFLPTQQQ
ncbi:MAG: hypothetical protein ACE5K7_02510 [Phycisphaerae bacterium]